MRNGHAVRGLDGRYLSKTGDFSFQWGDAPKSVFPTWEGARALADSAKIDPSKYEVVFADCDTREEFRGRAIEQSDERVTGIGQ